MPFFGIALLIWIPICAGLFAVYAPVRACTVAYLIGWLLLPVGAIQVRGFWDLDKVLATNVGVALGVVLFASRSLSGYRLRTADLLLALFIASSFIASITNGLGVKDGVSGLGRTTLYYGIPFFMGRILCDSREKLTLVARLIVLGAALYTVLVVYEWRMSPQIHRHLYGFFQHSWIQHYRWGSYRPIVCFPHALGLGMFVAWAATLALDLWQHRAPNGRRVISTWIVGAIALSVALSMSMAPWALFILGCCGVYLWKRPARRWIALVPVLFCIYWVAGRYTGIVDGRWLTSAAERISADRASSLDYRINAEDMLLERARQRPIFGWAGWGRSRMDEYGRDLRTAVDGMWIIVLGLYGMVGLGAFLAWWWTPILITLRSPWLVEQIPGLRGTIIALGMQSVNLMFNGFLSPVLTFLAGGLVTVLASSARKPALVARLH